MQLIQFGTLENWLCVYLPPGTRRLRCRPCRARSFRSACVCSTTIDSLFVLSPVDTRRYIVWHSTSLCSLHFYRSHRNPSMVEHKQRPFTVETEIHSSAWWTRRCRYWCWCWCVYISEYCVRTRYFFSCLTSGTFIVSGEMPLFIYLCATLNLSIASEETNWTKQHVHVAVVVVVVVLLQTVAPSLHFIKFYRQHYFCFTRQTLRMHVFGCSNFKMKRFP